MWFWMAVIFFVSHQNNDNLQDPVNWLSQFLEKLNIAIPFDKVAHFGAYGILGITAYVAWPKSPVKAVAVCVAYGLSDEIHQMFVPGRSCDPWDWLADSLGALVAVVLLCWLAPLVGKAKSKGAQN